MSNNADKIAKLREEADKLERADAAFNALPEEYKLAITLHVMQCRWNHADGCGWYYEMKDGVHNWNGQSHEPYLRKAQVLTTFCNRRNLCIEDAVALLQLVKE